MERHVNVSDPYATAANLRAPRQRVALIQLDAPLIVMGMESAYVALTLTRRSTHAITPACLVALCIPLTVVILRIPLTT